MSAYERFSTSRPPRPITQLSRAQIAGRVAVLRQMLDLAAEIVELDRGEPFTCRGALKFSLIQHEEEFRQRDRTAPVTPFAAAVLEPAAEQRLTAASAELHQVLTDICADAVSAAQEG